MKELFEYILLALACPLVLPFVDTTDGIRVFETEHVIKAESEDKV